MPINSNTRLSKFPITTQTYLASEGFDLNCSGSLEQKLYSFSFVENQVKKISPLQFMIETFYTSSYSERALYDLIDSCDGDFLSCGRVSAIEYVVEVVPREIEVIKMIAKKSLQEDLGKALKLIQKEEEFRKSTLNYYVVWFCEMMNTGAPQVSPISWLYDDELCEVKSILQKQLNRS